MDAMLKIAFLVFGFVAMQIQYCSAQEKIRIQIFKEGTIGLDDKDVVAEITNAELMSNPRYINLAKAEIKFTGKNQNELLSQGLIDKHFPLGTLYRYTKVDDPVQLAAGKSAYDIKTCSLKVCAYTFKSPLANLGLVGATANFTLHFIVNGQSVTLIGNLGAPLMRGKNEFGVDKDDNKGMEIADVAMAYVGMIGKEFTSTYNRNLKVDIAIAGKITKVTMRKNRGNEPYLVIEFEASTTPGGGTTETNVVTKLYPGEEYISIDTALYAGTSLFEEVTRLHFAALKGPFPEDATNNGNRKEEFRMTSVILQKKELLTVGRCRGYV